MWNMLRISVSDSSEKRTVVHGVGQGHSPGGVYEGDVKDSFHGGLIKAWKCLPGIGCLHLAYGQNSDKRQHIL